MDRSGLRAWTRASAFALVTAGLAACAVVEPDVACTGEFVYGLHVTAVDSTTGAPVLEGLAGVATREGVPEDMVIFENQLFGAGETPGVYQASVTADGYLPWSRSGVEVTEDECHVLTESFTALMQTEGAPD